MENQEQKKTRKVREMQNYKFALWMDGKGFFKEGMGFTFDSTEAKIYSRGSEVRKARESIEKYIGIGGFKIIEFTKFQ